MALGVIAPLRRPGALVGSGCLGKRKAPLDVHPEAPPSDTLSLAEL
jgi:hypothetical protein